MMRNSIKALVLIALGLFLYSRYAGGQLAFYINERFSWLTLFAAIGFLVLAFSYRYGRQVNDPTRAVVGWGGLFLVALPVLLGVLVPPKPLGAAAMSNRDVSLESLTSVSAPDRGAVLRSQDREPNILDWLVEFRSTPDATTFDGEEATVIGFVYRDARFSDDTFMLSRFIVSCCAADASPIGLVAQWPEASTLELDQWVEVSGYFEAGEFDGQTMPILQITAITETELPDQPYLYP